MKRIDDGVETDPLDILGRRLASGDIEKTEYEAIKEAILSKRPSTVSRRRRSFPSGSSLTIPILLAVVLSVAVASVALVAYNPWGASQGGTWPWGRWGGGNSQQVAIVNYAFSPQKITVQVGTTVTWVNMDHVVHTVSFGGHGDEHGIDSGSMGHMGVFSYTFTEPGVYEYHCDPHPYMTAKVTVEG